MRDIDWFEYCGYLLRYRLYVAEFKIFVEKVVILFANVWLRLQSALSYIQNFGDQ
jgi:hypothetical protein